MDPRGLEIATTEVFRSLEGDLDGLGTAAAIQ